MQRNGRFVSGRGRQKGNNGRAQFAIFAEPADGDLDNLGAAADCCRVFPCAGVLDRFEAETSSGPEEIKADRIVRFDQQIGGLRIKCDAADPLDQPLRT